MPTVLQKPRKKKDTTDGTTRGMPWNTILFNCNCHSFEDVAKQLMKAIRVSYERGMQIADVVHSSGKAVVYTIATASQCSRWCWKRSGSSPKSANDHRLGYGRRDRH